METERKIKAYDVLRSFRLNVTNNVSRNEGVEPEWSVYQDSTHVITDADTHEVLNPTLFGFGDTLADAVDDWLDKYHNQRVGKSHVQENEKHPDGCGCFRCLIDRQRVLDATDGWKLYFSVVKSGLPKHESAGSGSGGDADRNE